MKNPCTASVLEDDTDEIVMCALEAHSGNVHARGFLMWEYQGEYAYSWWTCRQYDEQGNYIFPGDPRWSG